LDDSQVGELNKAFIHGKNIEITDAIREYASED